MNPESFISPGDEIPKPAINLIITAHKLSLLVLLQYYVQSDPSTRSLKRELAVYLVNYIKVLCISLIQLKSCQKKINNTKDQEPTLLQLTNDINQFKTINTEDLIDFLFTKVINNKLYLILHQLNEFSSPDDLYDFLASQADLLEIPIEEHEIDDDSVRVVSHSNHSHFLTKKAGNSFFGLFIRKILLSFRKLSFQQLSSLFIQTNAYRDLYLEQQSVSMEIDEEMDITPIKKQNNVNKIKK